MMRSDIITGSVGPQPVRLRFSVDEYYKMYELGLIRDFERSEIIDGELIRKMGIGDRHAAIVDFLARFFIKNLSDKILVRIQNPLRLNDFDEPEPDFVLADLTKYDGKRHPRPAETLIVIEVSDTSLRYDRDTKLPLYAESEIPEVWIVNLPSNLIEVHQKPAVGIYQTVKIYRQGEIVESSILPGLKPSVDAILSE
ncbi:Uma2 family endonuclease [soil metagenome]